MKKIIYITSTITLLLLSGYFSFFLTQKYAIWSNVQSSLLKEKYKNTEDISYLLQLSVIKPERKHFELVIYNALQNGDFTLADTYNLFADVENYDLLATESALMHKDEYFTKKYLSNLTESQKKEVELFLYLNETGDKAIINKPDTNIGKMAEMIIQNNFELYSIDSPTGERLTAITLKYPKKSEQSLAVAHHFKDLSYYGISARITDNITQSEKCSKEAFIANSKAKSLAGKHSDALVSLEKYLDCDSVDIDVLSLLINYAKRVADNQREYLYSNRLKKIELIK